MEKGSEQRKKELKNLLRELHTSTNPEEVQPRLEKYLKSADQTEICQAEDELIKEGLPREKVHQLCNVHLSILKQFPASPLRVPPGHPVHTFMEEHKGIEGYIKDLKEVTGRIALAESFKAIGEEIKQLKNITGRLLEIETHNVREENVLFPYLEKHGVSGPPAVMWSEHNELRERKKSLNELLNKYETMQFKDFAAVLEEVSGFIIRTTTDHIFKENNVLYPAALNVISEEEWSEIRKECDELGYCCMPAEYIESITRGKEGIQPEITREGQLVFETGNLSKDEIEAIFNHLPVDITFVDKDDKVRYFTKPEKRIFPRTKAIIGRTVQQCHPQKSLHIVNQILNDFREGRRQTAEFWIKMKESLIFIRYYALRDKNGEYLGCVEVTQDIADLRKITGEKRLL